MMANHHLLDINIDDKHRLLYWNINAFWIEIWMMASHHLLDWNIDDGNPSLTELKY